MAQGFVWYELVTNGIDAAAEFYGKVTGWDIRDSGMPGMKYLLFGKDGKDVGGMMDWAGTGTGGGSGPAEWMAHIYTPDVDAEVASVKADGGTVVRPPTDIPHVGRFAVVTDPQGAKFLLFQPSQQYAPERLKQNEPGNIGWHELLTSDWEAAWEFYSKHYGWQKDYAMDMKEHGIYQTFRTGTDKYTGAMMTDFVPGGKPRWQFYIQVPDVDMAVPTILENGGKVAHGPMDVPGGSRIVQAFDPQGGFFALVSAKA